LQGLTSATDVAASNDLEVVVVEVASRVIFDAEQDAAACQSRTIALETEVVASAGIVGIGREDVNSSSGGRSRL
jgi:hypothetical protein